MLNEKKLGTIEISSDILSKANIGLWAFELDEGKAPRMYVDEPMLRLLGLPHQIPPEETYHAWYDHIDEGSYELVNTAVGKMRSGEHAEVQYPWHHPDGHTMIVRCGGMINPEYKDGIRIEGTHQDVSQVLHYDEQENELAGAKRTLDMFLTLAGEYDVVFVIDPKTGKYDWIMGKMKVAQENTALMEHGEDYYNTVVTDSTVAVHPEDRDRFIEFYTKERLLNILKTGKREELEIRWFTDEENRYRWKSNRVVRMYDDSGKAYITIGVIDIDEKREKEEILIRQNVQIEEQRNQLQKALDFAQVANHRLIEQKSFLDYFVESYSSAYSVDLIHNKFEILHMSHDFSEVFTMNGSCKDMENFILKHVHPDDQEMMTQMTQKEYITNRLREENDLSFTVREVYGGTTRTMRGVIVRGVDEYHVAVGFLDITKDVLKEAENQKQLTDALSMARSANRAKTAFLNNMSHDIRTPMNAIIGYTELAENNIDNKDRVMDYLSKITLSSNHLLSLINDVLDMSRIESGKMELCEMEENVSDILHTVSDLVSGDLSSKKMELVLDTKEVRHSEIVCDKLRVNRVLINVLSNAIKYSSVGSSVSLIVKEIAAKNSYSTFEFIVKDSGAGMDEDFLATIFEPFTREKSSTQSGIQGTGLGMTIAKSIVDLMGGSISVESKVGVGTEVTIHFVFRLPGENNEPGKTTVINRVSDKFPGFSGKKILLVEDNELNREIVTELLKAYGFIIEEASDGDVALERLKGFKKGDFDLILMDIQMPHLNGYEATKQIREFKNPASKLPIIAMTANAFEEDRKAAIEAGMDEHIAKPIDINRLLDTLAKFLLKDL